jgi:lysosomal alpha-glucosidase
LIRQSPSSFQDVQILQATVCISGGDFLLKIVDPTAPSEESLFETNSESFTKVKDSTSKYTVTLTNGILAITRIESNRLIWSANLQTLIFAPNFIQLDTNVVTPALYGLGERVDSFQKTDFNYHRYTFMNRDRIPIPNSNLYGSHPTYLIVEPDGKAHQALFFNSYPGEAIMRPGPAITWRFLGGSISIYFMIEQSPLEAMKEYTKMVGRPFMPPAWSLGFHLCRWGYGSLNETRATYQRMRDAKIPFDVQWNDIDYMDSFNDFTYDPVAFDGLPEFVDELHSNDMHYIPILDPGLDGTYLNGDKYPGFTTDVVIQNPDGSPLRGKVWNRNWTAWIDFTGDVGQRFWLSTLKGFQKKVKFDGLWLDMNDPSNEVDGSLDGCVGNGLDYPVYVPGDDLDPIFKKTVCMSAKHKRGSHLHFHNLYSTLQALVTDLYGSPTVSD